MKKLITIALAGLSFACVASLATTWPGYPPQAPTYACSAPQNYPPVAPDTNYQTPGDPNTQSFCNCYAGTAAVTCNIVNPSEQALCQGPPSGLIVQTCSAIIELGQGSIQNFCQTQQYQDPAINVANCVADLTYMCNPQSGTWLNTCSSSWGNVPPTGVHPVAVRSTR